MLPSFADIGAGGTRQSDQTRNAGRTRHAALSIVIASASACCASQENSSFGSPPRRAPAYNSLNSAICGLNVSALWKWMLPPARFRSSHGSILSMVRECRQRVLWLEKD